MDGWVLLLNREINGEFNRELYLLKARGISHSNQVREFIMSNTGLHLLAPYLGEGGALTGSARRNEEARARRSEVDRLAEVDRVQIRSRSGGGAHWPRSRRSGPTSTPTRPSSSASSRPRKFISSRAGPMPRPWRTAGA
jgi:hypothetical protein